MLDLVMLFNALTQALSRIRPPLARHLGQPMLTAALLTSLYAGYHVVHEASLMEGLRVAFLENNESRAVRLREREDATVQAELRHVADANRVIDGLLTTLIDHAPAAARARLDIIHNGVTGVTGIGLLRYDITNSIAGPGHTPTPLALNRPLAEWSHLLPGLLAGQCGTYAAGDLLGTAFRQRLEPMNTGTFLVCPAADMQGRLLGAVFVFWDAGAPVPEDQALRQLMALGKEAGTQIATVLDLRAPHGGVTGGGG